MTIARTARLTGKTAVAVLLLPAAMLVLDAEAQTWETGWTGWYGGFNVGRTRATIDDARINRSLLAAGFTTTSLAEDDKDQGYKVFGGYQFSRHFALEGGVFDLGEFGFAATTIPAGTFNGNIRLRGVNLDLVGTLPITENFSVIGRAGIQHAEARDRFSSTGQIRVIDPNPTKRDSNLKLGLGLQYAFSPSWVLRTEVERYRIDDAVGNKGDIDMVSIGLVYRFGGPTHRMASRAAPEPVALAPVAMPPAVMPPPPAPPAAMPPSPPPPPPRQPAPTQKVRFSADTLFDFDRAILKPAGRGALDRFVSDIAGARLEMILVTGHTDRIGSEAYNQRLSTRRAEAVRDYLVSSGGISAAAIQATGRSGSEPETRPEQCPGRVSTPSLIACLQPDRRVEVVVTGTR